MSCGEEGVCDAHGGEHRLDIMHADDVCAREDGSRDRGRVAYLQWRRFPCFFMIGQRPDRAAGRLRRDGVEPLSGHHGLHEGLARGSNQDRKAKLLQPRELGKNLEILPPGFSESQAWIDHQL